MTAQVLFFDVFSEKDPHLNAVDYQICSEKKGKVSHNAECKSIKHFKILVFLEFTTSRVLHNI